MNDPTQRVDKAAARLWAAAFVAELNPLEERIETVTDDSDLEEVYDTERHLLYVACARARDHLLIKGINPASEFLDDLASP